MHDIGALLTSIGLPATPSGGLSLATMPAWAAWCIYAWRFPRVQAALLRLCISLGVRWPNLIVLRRILLWDELPRAAQWLSPLVPGLIGAAVALATGAADWSTAGAGLAWGLGGAVLYHFAVGQPVGAVTTFAASKLAAYMPRTASGLAGVAGVVAKVDHEAVREAGGGAP